MAKKLTVEVDADVTKAKRKVKTIAEGIEQTAAGAGVGSDVSSAASKSIKNLGDSAKQANVNLTGLTRAFVGIGTSMAMSYAASRMSPGAARDAVEYGSSILGGASAGAAAGGMAAGPWGAAAGAVIGGTAAGVKTYLNKSDEQAKYIKDFEASEAIFENARAWQKKLRQLTEEMNADEISTIIANLRNSEQTFKSKAMERAQGGDYEGANDARRAMGDARSRIEQLESLQRAMAKAKDPRISTEGMDALSRIGGGSGRGDFAREQLNVQREMAATLKSIDRKGQAGTSWQ